MGEANREGMSGPINIFVEQDLKTPGIMAMLDQSELVLDITTLDRAQILEKFEHLYANKADVTARLQTALVGVKQQAQVNVDMIKALLN